jgi:hypothetical protein
LWKKAPQLDNVRRMIHAAPKLSCSSEPISKIPGWVTSTKTERIEDASFFSGAALAHLHGTIGQEVLPLALLRDRLALRAAEALMAQSGRPERAAELRDAVLLLRPGDLPGPAGEVYLVWRRAVERPLSPRSLHRAMPDIGPDRIGRWLEAGRGAPLVRAAAVMEAVLSEAPRSERAALILADAALAQALGWDHLLPLLAIGLKGADLRKRGSDLQLACHRAVVPSAVEVVRLAADLARRAGHLQAVAPRLRAKGAADAVEMFLTRDAVSPSVLPLPDRAARRLCDRLIDLGAIRELTGRDTFRLYGV